MPLRRNDDSDQGNRRAAADSSLGRAGIVRGDADDPVSGERAQPSR
jgi:hypothetical protein